MANRQITLTIQAWEHPQGPNSYPPFPAANSSFRRPEEVAAAASAVVQTEDEPEEQADSSAFDQVACCAAAASEEGEVRREIHRRWEGAACPCCWAEEVGTAAVAGCCRVVVGVVGQEGEACVGQTAAAAAAGRVEGAFHRLGEVGRLLAARTLSSCCCAVYCRLVSLCVCRRARAAAAGSVGVGFGL